MKKKAVIMGIESSCDETAVSIIQDNESGIPKILSNLEQKNLWYYYESNYVELTYLLALKRQYGAVYCCGNVAITLVKNNKA